MNVSAVTEHLQYQDNMVSKYNFACFYIGKLARFYISALQCYLSMVLDFVSGRLENLLGQNSAVAGLLYE